MKNKKSNTQCPAAPPNKKEYITTIGKLLVAEHGKHNYYKPEDVKKASKKSKYYDSKNGIDWHCWAMCTFSSHTDFNAYHKITGEVCNYVEMKTEMLSGLAISTSDDWLAISDIDIDASWLDFGSSFDELFEGIGEFIGGIFDGL